MALDELFVELQEANMAVNATKAETEKLANDLAFAQGCLVTFNQEDGHLYLSIPPRDLL